METNNRCLLLDANNKLTIVNKEIPEIADYEVLVKITYNGICGSDVHFFREGKLGNFVVTEPYTPGHEASGVIAKTGGKAKDFKIGDRVVIEPGIPCGVCEYCKIGRYNLCPDVVFLSAPPINGTFCDYLAINSHFVFHIPDSLSLEHAALVEPTAVAIQAVNRGRFANGATGVILGAGPIGLLTLQAFKAAGGGYAVCVDILDSRLETAKAVGADEVINPITNMKNLSSFADIVFETAGNVKTTSQMFDIAKPGGCAVQIGWPNNNIVPLDVATFMEKEIDYMGVNRYANAYPAAIAWLSDGRIKAEKMISHLYDFDDVTEAFEFARDNPKDTIKILVKN